MEKTRSGQCIRIVERELNGATCTIGELSPAMASEELSCKNSSIQQETLFVIIANEKMYTIDGVNRRKGYVAIDSESFLAYTSASVKWAKLFGKNELDQFINRSQVFLSSGYSIIELNF